MYGVKPGESDAARGLGFALVYAAVVIMLACIGIMVFLVSKAHGAEIAYGNAPPGFFACAYVRHDPACAADTASRSAVPENAELEDRLERVNAAVNDALWKYQCSPIGYNGPNGEPNYWKSYDPEHPTFARRACVNCINYAATKRRVLLASGLPKNALRYAHVRYKWSYAMTHIILLVYTSARPSNPYVLDSISVAGGSPDTVWRWSDVGTYYVMLETQDAHGAWRSEHNE